MADLNTQYRDRLRFKPPDALEEYGIEIPEIANIRWEDVKCGKENCNDCPHGSYYYAYWTDVNTNELKKKYLGTR